MGRPDTLQKPRRMSRERERERDRTCQPLFDLQVGTYLHSCVSSERFDNIRHGAASHALEFAPQRRTNDVSLKHCRLHGEAFCALNRNDVT